ncbi:MAG: hypothetical protein ABSB75_04875 [Candidatus Limnocylindrales bacterium]
MRSAPGKPAGADRHLILVARAPLPGALVPVLLEDGTCGQRFSAQEYR